MAGCRRSGEKEAQVDAHGRLYHGRAHGARARRFTTHLALRATALNGEGGVGNAIAGSCDRDGRLGWHLDIGIKGVPGTAMQAFGGQLNDVDMAAVITYQRNAFGNNMGDMVQPIDVFNHKKG